MEAIFMDSLFKTTRILDNFTSFIWNDRYCGYGDFELRFPMDDYSLLGIKEGYYVSIKETDRYMIVDGINISTSVEEGNYATISGRSLESILERRIVYEDSLLSGNLQDCVMRLLNANVINPENPNRKIPKLSFLKSTDPEITSLTIEMEIYAGDNLYDTVYDICNSCHVGFKILPEENGAMSFSLYKGLDRTYSQEKNPWIVFSPKFENLKTSKMDMNTEDLRNCIIARSEYSETKVNKQGEDYDKLIAEKGGWTLIVSSKNESTGEVTEEQETVDHRIEIVVGNELSGLERREMFKKSREIPEAIDESQFGKASDRVNIRDYQTWEAVYFDQSGYNEAWNEGMNRYSEFYTPIPQNHYEYQQVWLKPGDEGYDPNMANVGQSKTVQVFVPGATKQEANRINNKNEALYDYWIPNPSDYTHYAWVLTDEAGYRAALDNAQAEIDAEIAAAKQAAAELTGGIIRGDAEAELSKHFRISSFDGEIDPNVQYIYGKDYNLGDLVQIVNEFNFQAQTRVVSIMFSQEEGIGYAVMPTFESDDKAVFEIA